MAETMELKKIEFFFQESGEGKAWGPGTREGLLERDFTHANNFSRRLGGEMRTSAVTIGRPTQWPCLPTYTYSYASIHAYLSVET